MNVILLSLDTLRADHLSCYGYRRLTSPHIDRVAAQGTLCTEFFSPHIPTHPGYTTMLTGRDAVSHQIVCQGGTVEPGEDVRFLAEILAEQGYRTAAVDNLGRWLTRGFQTYQTYRWPLDVDQPWRKAEAVNAAALPLLAELAAGGQPFFLFVHYWDPHTPYLPPPPFDRMFYGGDERDPANRSMAPVFAFEPFGDYFRSWMGHVTDIQYVIAQYDAEIAYLDATLSAFFTRLDELGLSDDTLLILNADHGECLDEHECWFDHHGLYDQNLHVPLILRCPGLIPAGQRLGGILRQQDLAPAILDALGLGELAAANRMDGVSFLPLLRAGDSSGVCDTLFVTENSWMKKRGVRTRRWKLILAHQPDFHGKPPVELYDLAADPAETVNVAGERADVVAELTGQYDDWLTGRMAASGKPDPQSYQGTSLHRIGAVKLAVPADERLYAEGGKADR
jgi:arylsulfatase A-like enzyme